MTPVPAGWTETTLGTVRLGRGLSIDPSKHPSERFDLYSIPAHPTGKPESVLGSEIGSSKQAVSTGTVLLGKLNPRINRVWIVGDTQSGRAIASTEWIAFAPTPGVSPEYLAHFLRQTTVRDYLAQNVSGIGGSLMRVRPAVVDPFPLVLAPLNQQKTIVDVLDSHLSRLDATTATLERVQRKLQRYRASLLKSAVEGRLVPTEADLSRLVSGTYETASDLLERILVERRSRWEANGREGRYSEPLTFKTSTLPAVPEGWCWTRLEQLADVSGGLTKNPRREALLSRVPYLRVANVYADELRLDDVTEIGVSDGELRRVLLERDDLLVVEGNGSPGQIGRVALWDGSIAPCVHQNHIIKARFVDPEMARWAMVWLSSPEGRKSINLVASSTSGLHTLSLSKVGSLPVPLAPLAEQRRITTEVSKQQSILTATALSVSGDLARILGLRSAVLRAAFRGELD